MNACTDCGNSTLRQRCVACRRAAKREELRRLPMPEYHPPQRTVEEQAEAEARVAELREAEGDLDRLAEAATESLRRHLGRRRL